MDGTIRFERRDGCPLFELMDLPSEFHRQRVVIRASPETVN